MAHLVSAIAFALLFIGLGAAMQLMLRRCWSEIAAALLMERAPVRPDRRPARARLRARRAAA